MYMKIREYILKRDPVRYARQIGVRIGNDCRILCDPQVAFGSEPWLISIGNHVEITSNVRFITHDGGVWVIREKNPNIDVFGPIRIGNNVFIGNGVIILPNTNIGDNCVIGAGSIVTSNIPSNTVYAGVPAKFIKKYDDYVVDSLKKGFFTKAMTREVKREYLRRVKPEWFSLES